MWSKLTPPWGSQFVIDLYKENLKRHLFNRKWELDKTQPGNDPWVVPYQNYSNGSDWLHKYVTFLKCNF